MAPSTERFKVDVSRFTQTPRSDTDEKKSGKKKQQQKEEEEEEEVEHDEAEETGETAKPAAANAA